MQTSSVDQGKGITKANLLKIVPFTKRQLTELCSEGWLPPLQRNSRPGSKKPVYIWDESVIEQAKFLYYLLQWDRTHQWVGLPLWLQGYAVDFAPLRQRWLQSIDANLQAFMQGNEEKEDYPGDDPEDYISRVIDRMKDRWKHTPTLYRPELLRQFGIEAYALWAESFLDGLLVADYELDETTFAATLGEDFLPRLQTLQEILALPRLREVIEQATPEAWERARLDYMTLCQFFRTLSASLGQTDLEGMDLWLFAVDGFFLVPVALAIRQRRYGHWIDDAFAWMIKWLTNPETQALLTRISELLAESETRARLTEPEVYMRIIKQLSQHSSETNA
jgi:hypothetical protein